MYYDQNVDNPPVWHVALAEFTYYELPVGGTVSAWGLSLRQPCKGVLHFAPSPPRVSTRTSFPSWVLVTSCDVSLPQMFICLSTFSSSLYFFSSPLPTLGTFFTSLSLIVAVHANLCDSSLCLSLARPLFNGSSMKRVRSLLLFTRNVVCASPK